MVDWLRGSNASEVSPHLDPLPAPSGERKKTSVRLNSLFSELPRRHAGHSLSLRKSVGVRVRFDCIAGLNELEQTARLTAGPNYSRSSAGPSSMNELRPSTGGQIVRTILETQHIFILRHSERCGS